MTPPFFSWLISAIPLIVPIVIWALLLVFFLSLLFALDDGVKRLRRLHQIPCDRCLYNTGNPYLRCPVNPLSAFSEDAIHCRDFEPAPACPRRQLAKSQGRKPRFLTLR